MNRYKIALLALCCTTIMAVQAQTNGSTSSYSRFGLGLLNEQTQSFNRSMGGVGQGLRYGTRVNKLNPASYSAIDSLTFILDVGMGLQRTRYSLQGSHQTSDNTAFDNVNTGFRILPNLGMSIGFVPYSSIGYSFSETSDVTQGAFSQQATTQTLSYTGDGGLHEAYIGAGWRPFANAKWQTLRQFSIGANVGYLWGNINHQVVQTFAENNTSSSAYSSLGTYYKASLSTWKADIGMQFQQILNPDNMLTIGATVGIGHKIGGDATMLRTVQSGDTITHTASDAFQLPMSYSIGAAWEHAGRLTVAGDVTYENWASCTSPQQTATGGYAAMKGGFSDRIRINAGTEYVPDRYNSHSYLKRVCYRFGAYYSTPYVKVNGLDGPREYGLSAGLGLPIQNRWNNRPVLNIGVQWTRRDASSSTLMSENVFRINIGITFDETWFRKWKFQ